MNSTDPAEFEAYLAQFPNGVFRALAEARLAALRAPVGDAPTAPGRLAGGVGSSAPAVARLDPPARDPSGPAASEPGGVVSACSGKVNWKSWMLTTGRTGTRQAKADRIMPQIPLRL